MPCPVQLQKNAKLWGAIVNGKKVTPVSGKSATLLPLPQNADPNTLITVDLKLAKPGSEVEELAISTPAIQAPVLLTDWTFHPEPGYRLDYVGGNIEPLVTQAPVANGFTWLQEVVSFEGSRRPFGYIVGAFLCALSSVVLIQMARRSKKNWREQPVPLLGFAGITLCGIAIILSLRLAELVPAFQAFEETEETSLAFRAPIQLAGAQLQVNVQNTELEEKKELLASTTTWPAILSGIVLVAGLGVTLAPGKMRIGGNLLASAGWIGILYGLLSQPGGAQHFPPLLT